MAVQFYLYTRSAYVWDEKGFAGHMAAKAATLRAGAIGGRGLIDFFLRYDNMLGYGAAYWLFSTAVAAIGAMTPIGASVALRCAALLAMLAPPSLALKKANDTSGPAGFGILLLWLASPFA